MAAQPDWGVWMYELVRELFPLHRSITGPGLRKTLRRIAEEIPLEIHEVPTGTPVLDWTVPREWTVREAWIDDPHGRRVVDLANSNLHVVGYSAPVRAVMSLAELRPHLHSLPDQPDRIPYRTSYYQENWGFCLRHRDLAALEDGNYRVRIEAEFEPGALSYGECYLPGDSADEILISCHCCHPSLANDNLSGIAVATALAGVLAHRPRPLSYRFLFIPGTIGSITWLARNEAAAARIRHGLVLACIGDRGPVSYKRSRRGNALVDRAAAHVLKHLGVPDRVRDFIPFGYDERQYGSPGFNLPVGLFSRTPNGEFPEYHTSADDLDFVTPEHLADSLATVLRILGIVEQDRAWVNLSPRGEPQLGRRGLYQNTGGAPRPPETAMAMLWVLNLSDGTATLLDIAERSGLPFEVVRAAAEALAGKGLLRAI